MWAHGILLGLILPNPKTVIQVQCLIVSVEKESFSGYPKTGEFPYLLKICVFYQWLWRLLKWVASMISKRINLTCSVNTFFCIQLHLDLKCLETNLQPCNVSVLKARIAANFVCNVKLSGANINNLWWGKKQKTEPQKETTIKKVLEVK